MNSQKALKDAEGKFMIDRRGARKRAMSIIVD